MKKLLILAIAALGLGLFMGESSTDLDKDPLQELKARLKNVPTASIVLADMKEEGTFFPSYYHNYMVIYQAVDPKKALDQKVSAIREAEPQWREVSEEIYNARKGLLGMTLYSKKDGKENTAVAPAGYEYVGDPRYGRWQTDSSGNRFWSFFGQYALLSMILGNRPVMYNDYSGYRGHYRTGRNTPWFGGRSKGSAAGAKVGSSAKTNQPSDFFQRRMARSRSQSSSFASKVNNRVGRSSVSVRGRSGGVGK
ncbi:hypothetical protein [Dethiosulfatarculus sandiegensis]|uniref:Uncharacterized protein n=1 Tax=Dethiosulfatarculus sandiegensis TaxID=1429043 RepID=A0A0D2JXZ5_9BACT|nr:hypothetical protein [Dethiosulfatarculus sandiegensis]KIX14430.1 hypothetical protein X474_09870 [Dethiosulfatarculus sandiegensis]